MSDEEKGLMAVESDRAIQQVQAGLVIAKRFPRDVSAAQKNIVSTCQNPNLAMQSMYSYPRGSERVEGPSIRLAEVLAQNWGNLDTGVIELDSRDGISTMMAYCCDLQTNYTKRSIFSVKHWRDTKGGGYALKDARDIYEMTANMGSRRLRACILAVIPPEIVDLAIEQCERTMKSAAGKQPLPDRLKAMASSFDELGISQSLLEKRLGHKLEVSTETEFLQLRKVFLAIRDGMGKPEDYFEIGDPEPSAVDKMNARFSNSPALTQPKPETKDQTEPGSFAAAPSGPLTTLSPKIGKKADIKGRGQLAIAIVNKAKASNMSLEDINQLSLTLFQKPMDKLEDAEMESILREISA